MYIIIIEVAHLDFVARYTQNRQSMKNSNSKVKTPKQAIKFVKTLNQTFKLRYPGIYEFNRKCI